jgi:hypothetical protein
MSARNRYQPWFSGERTLAWAQVDSLRSSVNAHDKECARLEREYFAAKIQRDEEWSRYHDLVIWLGTPSAKGGGAQ